MYVKNKQESEMEHLQEDFVDTAVKVKVTAGSTVGLIVNNNDLLANVRAASKKDNAMYLALIKIDGFPRIIDSYATGDSTIQNADNCQGWDCTVEGQKCIPPTKGSNDKNYVCVNKKWVEGESSEDLRFQDDLQIYFDKAKLLSDKYLMIFSKGSAYSNLSLASKNFIKNNLGANQIFDINAAVPYLLIYDPIDNNVRVEQVGKTGESITYQNTMYATKRDLAFNKDGLMISGLQCYLDATRKESYQPSFGTLWKDISGKGRDFRWQKGPSHADGKFLSTMFTSGSAFGPNCDTFDLGDGTKGFAIVMCAKTNTLQYGHAFVAQGVPNFYGIQAHTPWPDQRVYFDQGWPYAGENVNRISAEVGPCSEEMFVWAFVRDYNGAMKIYRNGALLVEGKIEGATPLNLKDVPFEIARSFDANISKFLIYNTFLTAEDVDGVTKWIQNDETSQRNARMKEQAKNVPEEVPVKLGLQLFLDTNNYEEGSLDWKDQSGNGYDFKWSTAPTVESKSFLLNGEYALSAKPSRLLNIDNNDYYTICWVAKTNNLSINSVFKIKGNHNNSRGIFCHPTWVNNFIYFDQAGCCDDNTQRVYGDVGSVSSEYAFYTLRKTKNERAIFVNGKRLAVRNTTGASININMESMIIGRDLEDGYTWFANLRNFMVYNRDLTDAEITRLFNRYYSKYEFGKYTYEAADSFCRKQGKKLCKVDDYCVNGKPTYLMDEDDKWAPIGDYPDGWIQLGKNGDSCKTFKQKCQIGKDGTCDPNGNPTWTNKVDREVGVLCCDIKYQPLVINAVLIEGSDPSVLNNKLTFFRDTIFQSISSSDVTDVTNIKEFPGLTPNFQKGNVDAIVNVSADQSVWFKERAIMTYSSSKKESQEFTFVNFFNKLPEDFVDGYVDAVATRGYSTEFIMFKKTRYCIVDMTTKTTVGYGNIKDKYKTLPLEFQLGYLDCAMWAGGSTSYLMKNDNLIQFDFSSNTISRGPVKISSVWDKLLPPFISKASVCKVYEKLVEQFKKDTMKQKYWNKKYYRECKRIAKTEYEVNLENYKKLVDKYNEEFKKDSSDLQEIESQIKLFEKALSDKKLEFRDYENKYLDIKMKPCKNDDVCSDKSVPVPTCKVTSTFVKPADPTKKQIVVKEYDTSTAPRAFTDINTNNMENCYYDPNVGTEFTDGFNFKAHPKAKEYIEATKIKKLSDFTIKDYPGIEKYILKTYIPKQKTSNDFKVEDHPDYMNYEVKPDDKPAIAQSGSGSSSSSSGGVPPPNTAAPAIPNIATVTPVAAPANPAPVLKVEPFENYRTGEKASLLEEAEASLRLADSLAKEKKKVFLEATTKCQIARSKTDKETAAKEYNMAKEISNQASASYDAALKSVKLAKELETDSSKKENKVDKSVKSKKPDNTDKRKEIKIVKTALVNTMVKADDVKSAYKEVENNAVKKDKVEDTFEIAKAKLLKAIAESKESHKRTEEAKTAVRKVLDNIQTCNKDYTKEVTNNIEEAKKKVKEIKKEHKMIRAKEKEKKQKVNKLMKVVDKSKDNLEKANTVLNDSKMNVTKATVDHISSVKAAKVIQVSTNYLINKEKAEEVYAEYKSSMKRVSYAKKEKNENKLNEAMVNEKKVKEKLQMVEKLLKESKEEFQRELNSYQCHNNAIIEAEQKKTAAAHVAAVHTLSEHDAEKEKLRSINKKKDKVLEKVKENKKVIKKKESTEKALQKEKEVIKNEVKDATKKAEVLTKKANKTNSQSDQLEATKVSLKCEEAKAKVYAIKQKISTIQKEIDLAKQKELKAKQVIKKVEKAIDTASQTVQKTEEKAKQSVETHAKALLSEKSTKENFTSTMTLIGSML
jgi:DNA repair exonuclease SbcCD ATPase subunit